LPEVKTLARIFRTPPADLLLVAEAWLMLFAARLALRRIPLAKLVEWLKSPAPIRNVTAAELTAGRIRWAILVVVTRNPGSYVCFPQSLAAYAMLWRRGIPSVLHYGVNRSPDNELRAHTWLKLGEMTVIGGEEAPDFTLLNTFP
jgi:Transglutaminase-like superfamily